MLELIYIILLFVLPVVSVIMSFISIRYNISMAGFFGGCLLIPSMIIITSLIK